MSGGFFVRWKQGEPRPCRVFDPLPADHPAAAMPCLVCENVLGDGRPVQLYAVGWHDEESRERHTAGRWYTAQAVLLHAACVANMSPAFAEQLTAEPELLLAPVELTQEQSDELKAQFEALSGGAGVAAVPVQEGQPE